MRVLKVPSYAAVGLLEKLWHLTAREAPAGNVGRLSDDDIADWLGWEQSSALLIDGLVEAGWLDRYEDPGVRLYIHDWHEHSDDTIDNHLARAVVRYANGALPRMTRLNKQEREHLIAQFAQPSSSVRTEAHEKPLPEPEPEPKPVPEPGETTLPGSPGLNHSAEVPIAAPNLDLEAKIELVYAAYPRPVAKGKAMAAIREAMLHLGTGKDMPAMAPADALRFLHGVVLMFARSPAGNKGEFTPYPDKFFRAKRYLDDVKEWQDGGNQANRERSANRGQQRIDAAFEAVRRAEAALAGGSLAADDGDSAGFGDGRRGAPALLEGAGRFH